MLKDFDFYKAYDFIEKSEQKPIILKGAKNVNPINYKYILSLIEDELIEETTFFLSYLEEEQLYCKLLMDNNYYLPYNLLQFRFAFVLLNYSLRDKRKANAFKKKIMKANMFSQEAFDTVKSTYKYLRG